MAGGAIMKKRKTMVAKMNEYISYRRNLGYKKFGTTEELFLLQKLMRDFGTSNIDTRLGRVDFTSDNNDPTYPSLGMDIADIEHLEATLLVGSNIHKEQPIAGIQLRKSTRDGTVMAINPIQMSYNFRTNPQVVTTAAEMLAELTAVAKALISMEGVEAVAGINELNVEVNDSHKTIAENLKNADKAAILFGQYACNHADFSKLAAIANAIAGIKAGATYVNTTINGLGERAGNAAFEELVMALKFIEGVDLGFNTKFFRSLSEVNKFITVLRSQL